MIGPSVKPADTNFVLIKAWDAVSAPTVFLNVTTSASTLAAWNRAAFQGADAVIIKADLGGCVDGIKDMGGIHVRDTDIRIVWVPVDDQQGGGPSHSDGAQLTASPKPSSYKRVRMSLPDRANSAVMVNGPRGDIVFDGLDVTVDAGGVIASVINVSGTVTKLTLTNCTFPDLDQVKAPADGSGKAHCWIPRAAAFTESGNKTRSGAAIVVRRT